MNLDWAIIIGYEIAFKGENNFSNAISYINDYGRKDLLSILSLINNYPKQDLFSLEIEVEDQFELFASCFDNRPDYLKAGKNISDHMADVNKLSTVSGLKATVSIFSRLSNLIAIEEILTSSLVKEESDVPVNMLNFLKFYLCINTKVKLLMDSQNTSDRKFSDLYPVLAVLGEHSTPSIPFMEFARGLKLIQYFRKDEKLSKHLYDYYNIKGFDPEEYITRLQEYINTVKTNERTIPIKFKSSHLLETKYLQSFSVDKLIKSNLSEVLNVKIGPMFRLGDKEFLLLDSKFLIDKCFDALLNGFYYEFLINRNVTSQEYFSNVGKFYENYITDLLQTGTKNRKDLSAKYRDELEVVQGKNSIELCDFFITNGNNFLIGEIKSSYLKANYKYSKEIIETFRDNRKRFIKDFGIRQNADQVARLINYPKLFNVSFNEKGQYDLFPVVVINEKIFQSPFSSVTFNDLFISELSKLLDWVDGSSTSGIHTNGVFNVYPITILSSVDVELLSFKIQNHEFDFFKELRVRMTGTRYTTPYFEFESTLYEDGFINFISSRYTEVLDEYKKLPNTLRVSKI